ncbi:PaaI family thioesterase [Algoriphagus aestuariicola]|uniref:PaaI family thioesterase n=1 Tax=Algoriphagus aestuariicola TaxID=1852016 RepID=A0ABS3BSS1_9BACT|nr:PaaI family thioesterase [Algoriphagus aestuariicola]MBN7802353.1 PaaI family thioesterase [Algoriphagus aestuariicola]
MENHSNQRLELFKSQIGSKLDNTPSLAGNWLEGTLLDIDSHHIRVAYTVRSEMCNPGKILHGGVASLMLDDVIGMGNFVAGSEYLMTSINLHVDFLSAAQIDEKLEVTAKLVRSGSNLNHWEAVIRKQSGKIVAKASSNMIKTHIKLNELGF